MARSRSHRHTSAKATGLAAEVMAAEIGQEPSDKTEAFALSLDGFEGPIDLLLFLVREKNFDLSQVSIGALASQYLAFLARIPEGQLQRAADYLVMASWLALLKSRLLLPREQQQELDEDPTVMAERLAGRLRQLKAMQQVAEQLRQRRQLGRDFFAAGHDQLLISEKRAEYKADLPSLVLALRRWQEKAAHKSLRLRLSALPVVSIDEARAHLRHIAGTLQQWHPLHAVAPKKELQNRAAMTDEDRQILARSRVASTLVASLEMQREGQLALRQPQIHDVIEVKSITPQKE